jgi:hypothetical protein
MSKTNTETEDVAGAKEKKWLCGSDASDLNRTDLAF